MDLEPPQPAPRHLPAQGCQARAAQARRQAGLRRQRRELRRVGGVGRVREERAVYEAGVLRLVQLTPGRSSDAARAGETGQWSVVWCV